MKETTRLVSNKHIFLFYLSTFTALKLKKMKISLNPKPITIFFFFFIALHLSPCFAIDLFKACGVSYHCGELVNITYPFWGNQRQRFCGQAEFELNCKPDRTTTIKINSMEYNVLRIDQSNHRMTIAISEVFNNICLKNTDEITQTTTTLDGEAFTYSWNNENITVWYNCSAKEKIPVSNRFWCGYETVGIENYAVGPGFELKDRSVIMEGCGKKLNVMVRVEEANEEEEAKEKNRTALLEKVVRRGFDVEYEGSLMLCDSCKHGGGICGGNASYPFYCICAAGDTNPFVCPSAPGTSSNLSKKKLIIVVIPAGCILLIISIIIFIYYRWKCIINREKIEEIMKRHSTELPKRYSYSKLKKITDSFKNKLGQGGFSTVYKGILPDGREVAVKILNDTKEDGQDFMNEVASITRTSHVNIVTLLGFCYEGNKRALIYEYMPKGSLEKYISHKGHEQNNVKLDWHTLNCIVMGIARGLEYLHRGCNTRILHCDIKPHNILLNNDFSPKISDFGLAKQCRTKESHVSMTGVKGTAGFMAPEIVFRNLGKVSHKSDVYSYGMLVLEMVGERKNPNNKGVGEKSEEYFPDWVYKDLAESERDGGGQWGNTMEEEDMVRKMIIVGLCCIQTLPEERPSMSNVVTMLQGSVDALQIPPKQALFGPVAPAPPQSSCPSSDWYL